MFTYCVCFFRRLIIYYLIILQCHRDCRTAIVDAFIHFIVLLHAYGDGQVCRSYDELEQQKKGGVFLIKAS